MPALIEPEPPEEERQAIVAALAGESGEPSAWGHAALAEGVDNPVPDPYPTVAVER